MRVNGSDRVDLVKPNLGKWVDDVEKHKALAVYSPPEGGYEGRYLNQLRYMGYRFLDLTTRSLEDPKTTLTKIHPVCPGMVELMVESTIALLNSWDAMIEHGGATAEIVVDEYFRNFSTDVISRACFGGSYSKGKEIFTKLRALSRVIAERRMHFDFPSWINLIWEGRQLQDGISHLRLITGSLCILQMLKALLYG